MDCYTGEIRLMPYDFAPRGWAQCNGQLLPVQQYAPLFALIGNTFGGDGKANFALPDLRGSAVLGFDASRPVGDKHGEAAHALTVAEMVPHIHKLMTDAATSGLSNSQTPSGATVLGQSAGKITPGESFPVSIYSDFAFGGALDSHALGDTGSGQPHENMQPFLAVNFCIALTGITPPRP